MYIIGSDCENGWESFKMGCYKIPADFNNSTSAENDCVQKGGHLASIHSKEENEFLLRLIGPADSPNHAPIMIVGGKVNNDQTFFWTDGTKFDYSYWQSGQPQHPYGTQDCIFMMPGGDASDGRWILERCDMPSRYICKKSFEGNIFLLF